MTSLRGRRGFDFTPAPIFLRTRHADPGIPPLRSVIPGFRQGSDEIHALQLNVMPDPFQQFGQYATRGGARVVESWRYVSRQPSWVVRAAIIAFVLVFAVPILLLAMVAVVAAAIVFFVLAAVYVLYIKARRAIVGDGRKNVRVIVRRE